MESSGPRITVIFLLYHAAASVPALMECLRKQKHPQHADQSEWLEAVFVDDCSKDATSQVVEDELRKAGSPSHYRFHRNATNQGLSKTLNQSFERVRTPFVLTCHCDCFFADENYVAGMLELLEKTPDAGAVTGQPSVLTDRPIPFAERVNLISNLMDIFPRAQDQDLIPVGFAEGRCDGFRMEALRTVGFYDTALRLAGEDQVIAGRMRKSGFHVYQAPKLVYFLSVSNSQDTLAKLARHQQLFGRAHPYILLKARGTKRGVVGGYAGKNRQDRTLLRINQLISVAVYALLLFMVAANGPLGFGLGMLALTYLWKTYLFRRHLRAVRMGPLEILALYAIQPLFDLYYAIGLAQGLWHLTRGTDSRPIP